MDCNIGIFANDEVGNDTLIFLLEHYPNDLKFVVCTDHGSIVFATLLKYKYNKDNIFLNSDLKNDDTISKIKLYHVKFILLAWWPYIIRKPILTTPTNGVLNFHPSLLPYNRGRNYNFWTIIEDTPFGVTIHFVDEGIDTGDIIFQQEIDKDWTDTGETLYIKAKKAMLDLFVKNYKSIRKDNFFRTKQNNSIASFRLAKEMEIASKIELDSLYTARELLNLLRARSFPPHPGIWFEQDGEKYEILISIKNKSNQ